MSLTNLSPIMSVIFIRLSQYSINCSTFATLCTEFIFMFRPSVTGSSVHENILLGGSVSTPPVLLLLFLNLIWTPSLLGIFARQPSHSTYASGVFSGFQCSHEVTQLQFNYIFLKEIHSWRTCHLLLALFVSYGRGKRLTKTISCYLSSRCYYKC